MKKRRPKLAIVTTHPIQYNAPLFALLGRRGRVTVKVFYTWGQAKGEIFDPGFGKHREWDIPLLQGYDYCFVPNKAKRPGSHHFMGIKNPNLISEIDAWQPDAVMVFGWSFYSHLKCLRHFKNKLPVFFRGDSTLLDEAVGLRSFFRRLVLTWVYKHVDKAFFAGSNNKDYFRKYGLEDAQLIYAPHAVDNDRFSAICLEEEIEVKRWRRELGFGDKDWVVLFVGKLEEKKDPFFLIELEKAIKEDYIKFLFVGNGPLESQLKKISKGNRIVFLDFQNQSKMPSVYRLGQLLVLPSKGPGETWGLAANEAMNCGLPVILSAKAGGARDLVKDGENGLVFTPGEVGKVADFIERFYLNKEQYRIAAEKSKQHIKSFCMENTAKAIERAVLKTERKPLCDM